MQQSRRRGSENRVHQHLQACARRLSRMLNSPGCRFALCRPRKAQHHPTPASSKQASRDRDFASGFEVDSADGVESAIELFRRLPPVSGSFERQQPDPIACQRQKWPEIGFARAVSDLQAGLRPSSSLTTPSRRPRCFEPGPRATLQGIWWRPDKHCSAALEPRRLRAHSPSADI